MKLSSSSAQECEIWSSAYFQQISNVLFSCTNKFSPEELIDMVFFLSDFYKKYF